MIDPTARRTLLTLTLALTLALATGRGAVASVSQDAPPPSDPPPATAPAGAGQDAEAGGVDAKSEEILRRMARHYREATQLSTDIEIVFTFDHTGHVGRYTSDYTLKFRRPSSIALVAAGTTESATVIADGRRMATYVPRTGLYVEEPCPESFVELMQRTAYAVDKTRSPSGGLEVLLLQALFSDDPYRAMLASSTRVQYIAEETIGEGESRQRTHRLRFLEPNGFLDIWVSAGEAPWVRRFTPDVSAKNAPTEVKFSLQVDFRGWHKGGLIDRDFVFTPPVGAKAASDFDEARGLRRQASEPPGSP